MNKISIDVVRPGRVETTIQPEEDWITQTPYCFVFGSLQEAMEALAELYAGIRSAQTSAHAEPILPRLG